MSSHFYDLLKYKKTGIANPNMTSYDKVKAHALCGGSIPINTITGEPPLTFRSDGSALTAWSISGNMAQSGTPTPSSPIQPQECGDKTANLAIVSAESLLTYSGSYNNFTLDTVSQTITTTGNALLGFVVAVEPSTQYTVNASCTKAGCFIRVREYSSRPTAWAGAEYIQQTFSEYIGAARSFTTTASTTYIAVAFYADDTKVGAEISEIMLNTGGTAMDYVHGGYAVPVTVGNQTQTIYLMEPIRQIDEYTDVAASDNTVTRLIATFDLAKLTWSYFTGSNYAIFWALVDRQLIERCKGYSNAFEVTTVAAFSSMPDNSLRVYEGSNRQQRLAIRYDAAEGSVSALKDMLTQNSAMAWLVMEEPETEQYNAPTISTAKGSNTLAIGTTLQPSSVSITGHIE